MRTIRGVVLTALTWGVLWGMVGLTIGLLWALRFFPDVMFMLFGAFLLAKAVSIVGLCAGATFAAVMAFTERGKTLGTISLRRAGAWGALGAIVYVMIELWIWTRASVHGGMPTGVILSTTAIAATLGAVSAAGSLAIARKGTSGLLEESTIARIPSPTPPRSG